MKPSLLFLLALFFLSCQNQGNINPDTDSVITFDATQKPINKHYTEFLKDIRFIHLPLALGYPMEDYYSDFIETDDRIVLWSGSNQSMVHGSRAIFFLSKEGKIISVLTDAGKDPFQPQDMVDIEYNKYRDEFALIDFMGKKLFRYDKNGKMISQFPLDFRAVQIATLDKDHYAIYWFSFGPVIDQKVGIFSINDGKIVKTHIAYREASQGGVSMTGPLFRDNRGVGFQVPQSDSILAVKKDTLAFSYRIDFGPKTLPAKFHQGFSVTSDENEWNSRYEKMSPFADLTKTFYSDDVLFVFFGYRKDYNLGVKQLRTGKEIIISHKALPGEYPYTLPLMGNKLVFNCNAANFIADADSLKSVRSPAEWESLMKKYP
ncbi:MAG: 6-bladed beta-propeller, partial [Bacteroidia bacterium]|nr:6-bladed beta-propeller [Bacteroidia bacterium]